MTGNTDSILRILLVEGDSVDRAALLRALRHGNHGLCITEARCLADACPLLLQHAVDVLLADYELPDGNATDLLDVVAAMDGDRPAVIIIGHDDDDSLAVQCIQYGAQAYLIKESFKPSLLLSSIAQARQLARQQGAQRQQTMKLQAIAEHDALTGLLNRHVFEESLQSCVARAERYGRPFGLLMIDLDGFKQINDLWGHCTGDALLREVAGILARVTSDSDDVYRIGGDEFAILLPETSHAREPAMLAERLAEAMLEPVCADDHEFTVTASIGIALYPEHGTTADQLLRNADKAMYRCKRRGHRPGAGLPAPAASPIMAGLRSTE